MDGSGTVVEQPPAVDVVVFELQCTDKNIARTSLLKQTK